MNWFNAVQLENTDQLGGCGSVWIMLDYWTSIPINNSYIQMYIFMRFSIKKLGPAENKLFFQEVDQTLYKTYLYLLRFLNTEYINILGTYSYCSVHPVFTDISALKTVSVIQILLNSETKFL